MQAIVERDVEIWTWGMSNSKRSIGDKFVRLEKYRDLERELAEARRELADFRDATVVFRQLPGEQDPEVDLSKKEVQR